MITRLWIAAGTRDLLIMYQLWNLSFYTLHVFITLTQPIIQEHSIIGVQYVVILEIDLCTHSNNYSVIVATSTTS